MTLVATMMAVECLSLPLDLQQAFLIRCMRQPHLGFHALQQHYWLNNFPWQDGNQLLAADNPESFAEKCLELYTQKDLWHTSIRDSAIESVDQDCSSDEFNQQLLSLFE